MAKGWQRVETIMPSAEKTFQEKRKIEKMIRFAYDITSKDGRERFLREEKEKELKSKPWLKTKK